MSERKLPWLKFEPASWQRDLSLHLRSPAARCLWIECICIMHDAEPYGHLTVSGRAMTHAELATVANIPVEDVPGLLAELEEAGVFSRTADGVIVSRRMIAAARRR